MLRSALIFFAVVVGAVAISRGDAAQQATVTLELRVTGVGGGVTARPSGVLTSCSGSRCNFQFQAGTSVTLTANGSQPARFARWLGACTHSQTTCTFSMSRSRSVTARFSPVRLYIDQSQGGSVAVSPAGAACGRGCSGEFNYGAEVILSARACCGYQFSSWSGVSCAGSQSNPCRFRIYDLVGAAANFVNCEGGECTAATRQPYSRTVYGVFVLKGSGRVSANGKECRSSGGTKNCRFPFTRGESVAVQAYGSRFRRWDGPCRGSVPRCQFAAFNDPNEKPPTVFATFYP